MEDDRFQQGSLRRILPDVCGVPPGKCGTERDIGCQPKPSHHPFISIFKVKRHCRGLIQKYASVTLNVEKIHL